MRQCLEDRKGYILHNAGGRKNVFTVHILPCKESGVKLMKVVNSYNGKSIFMQPLLSTFRDTPEILQDSMGVFAICDERDIHHPELNMPLLQDGSTFPYKLLLCACDENITDDEFGNTFAPALQTYINENPRYHGTDNHVVYRQPTVLTAAGKQPVRHWLKDRDMLLLLKKMYGWTSEVTLNDILADEELLGVFFATPDEGRAFLGRLSEEQWQSLET